MLPNYKKNREFTFPSGQDEIIALMQKWGYRSSEMGVCYGITHMAMQAFLARDLKTFNQRLNFIHKKIIVGNQINANFRNEKVDSLLDSLRQEYVTAKNKQLDLIKKSKSEAKIFYKNLSLQERLELENENQDKLTALELSYQQQLGNKSSEEKVNEIDAAYQNNRYKILFNAFKQKIIEKTLKQTLSADEHAVLDIDGFLEGIELNHQGYFWQELFDKKIHHQNAERTLLLTAPQILEKKDSIMKIDEFSCEYTKKDLMDYLNGLQQAVKNITSPFALILSSWDHTVMVAYDPEESPDQQWLFLDSSYLPHWHVGEVTALTDDILNAFLNKELTAFSTQIYALKSNEIMLNNFVNTWKNQESFKRIHRFTKTKSMVNPEYGAAWLYIAARQGNLNEVTALLSHGVNINFACEDGATALYGAVSYGHFDIVVKLLEIGADPNLDLYVDGSTPLFIAAEKGLFDIVVALLEIDPDPTKKANPDLACTDGVTPLYIAAERGYLNIVIALLEKQANPNLASNEGATPLYIAAQEGYIDIAKQLLAFGADPNLISNDGISPLYIAVEQNHFDIVVSLLEKNANPNLASDNGATPLYVAARLGYLNMVEILLKAGADPTLAYADGSTPLSSAKEQGHLAIVELLQNKISLNEPSIKNVSQSNLSDQPIHSPLTLFKTYSQEEKLPAKNLTVANDPNFEDKKKNKI